MEKVFASVSFSSPLPVAVARTSQSPFPLCDIVSKPVMNRKFILLTLTLISIICFSQTKDTIFLKKEKGHNIYKIQNRNSKMYNDLSNFKNFDEGKTEKIMKIGLNSKWIRIHKFNNEYFLYAPCDWCNDTKLQINDDFLQVSGCELIKEKIKSVKKINEKEYNIIFISRFPQKHKTNLRIKLIDSKYGIYEFRYPDGLELRKMLFIKDSDFRKFDIINNDCKFEKSAEFEFDE